eukprot:783933-Pelagomonas_calceolata.AAC.2
MHACTSRAMQAVQLLFIAYLLALDNQQQPVLLRLPYLHNKTGVQVLLHIARANFCALTCQLALHITT